MCGILNKQKDFCFYALLLSLDGWPAMGRSSFFLMSGDAGDRDDRFVRVGECQR